MQTSVPRKNKVLFLLHFPPPVHGSSIVGQNIKNSGLINSLFECSYVNLLASKNVTDTGKISLRKLFGFVNIFFKLFFSLLKNRPQICYLALTATGAAFYKDCLLIILLKLFRVKRVYHLHNKGIDIHRHKFLNRICYQFVFNKADVIILSKELYRDIQHFVPQSNVHICPNGIEDTNKDYADIASKKEQSAASATKILFLSNLIETKGVFVLLEALAVLKRKNVLFECTFIGGEADITASSFNEKKKQLGLTDEACYEGKKFGKEKQDAFLEAGIFVLPTYYSNECFPLVLLEAMSYSLPLISTFEGGIPDIVEEGVNGFLVPQKNIEALAEKLEVLLSNPALGYQMGIAGRKKYEQEFTLQQFEQTLAITLQQVIEKKYD
ncbi:MAG: glycosyltransferase family 4 protein [Chitinophagaceae bacterium]